MDVWGKAQYPHIIKITGFCEMRALAKPLLLFDEAQNSWYAYRGEKRKPPENHSCSAQREEAATNQKNQNTPTLKDMVR